MSTRYVKRAVRSARAAGGAPCRLCLEPRAPSGLYAGAVTLQEKIRICLEIEVDANDGLSQKICHKCERRLNSFYDFRQTCRSVDQKLRSFKKEPSEVVITNIKLDKSKETNIEVFNNINIKQESLIDACTDACTEVYHNEFDLNNDSIEVSSTKIDIPFLKTSIEEAPKYFQCETCGNFLKHKTALKKHLQSHTGVKLYSCNICNKGFTRLEHQKVHMRAHNGIRPYVCDICSRSFTKRQDLVRHMKVHYDLRTFSCTRCGRMFKRSGDVISHMKIHTGFKPYSCGSCEKSYSSHGGLKKHLSTYCKHAKVIYNYAKEKSRKLN